MKVQLFYFDNCPSYRKALEHLDQAMQAEGVHGQTELIPVMDDGDAQAKCFIGSPTIRIDGVDVEGPEADARGYAFGCRVYAADGKLMGWPSVAQIRKALRRPSAESGSAS